MNNDLRKKERQFVYDLINYIASYPYTKINKIAKRFNKTRKEMISLLLEMKHNGLISDYKDEIILECIMDNKDCLKRIINKNKNEIETLSYIHKKKYGMER